jgi:tyrosine-protein kinase Srms
MKYLADNNIIHRDFALRNLLLSGTDKLSVKVADFGLSRIMQGGYYKTDDKQIPVKWSAIEVLKTGTYTPKSDVWSFGVMLWELFSFGNVPYSGLSNMETVDQVCEKGYRLPLPKSCPIDLHELMKQCWLENAKHRPTFQEIIDDIEKVQKNTYPDSSSAQKQGKNVSFYMI